MLTRIAGVFATSTIFSCFNLAEPSWPAAVGRTLSALSPRSDGVPSVAAADIFSHDGDGDYQDTEPSSPAGECDVVGTVPLCVASSPFAGQLGSSVLYRYHREGSTLVVGYFVYWTTERPWGKNALSYSVFPALFIDAFYSHLFFLFPGAQRIIYGPGDVEGVRVAYRRRDDGRWEPTSAVADDVRHHEVDLSPGDFVDREGRVVFMIDGWSHQLGAKGASSFSQTSKDSFVCFDGGSLKPLTADIARAFRLGSPSDPRRASPAWHLLAAAHGHG